MTREDWLTIPNLITLARLVIFLPLTAWLLIDERIVAATIAVILFGCTDWVDGYLARKTHSVSKVGEVLDPVADRIGVIAICVALVVAGFIPLWFVLVIAITDVLLGIVGLARRANIARSRVSIWGKARTMLVMVALPLAVFARIPEIHSQVLAAVALWMLVVAAIMHVGVALHYALVLLGVVAPPHRFIPASPRDAVTPTDTGGSNG